MTASQKRDSVTLPPGDTVISQHRHSRSRWGCNEQSPLEISSGSIGITRSGEINRRTALPGCGVQVRTGADVVTHIGDCNDQAPTIASGLAIDGVVKVFRVGPVDGHQGQIAQILAAAPRSGPSHGKAIPPPAPLLRTKTHGAGHERESPSWFALPGRRNSGYRRQPAGWNHAAPCSPAGAAQTPFDTPWLRQYIRAPFHPGRGGGIGRRAGFRCQWGQPRGGSSPLLGTTKTAQ